jgi:hypothetical protein
MGDSISLQDAVVGWHTCGISELRLRRPVEVVFLRDVAVGLRGQALCKGLRHRSGHPNWLNRAGPHSHELASLGRRRSSSITVT